MPPQPVPGRSSATRRSDRASEGLLAPGRAVGVGEQHAEPGLGPELELVEPALAVLRVRAAVDAEQGRVPFGMVEVARPDEPGVELLTGGRRGGEPLGGVGGVPLVEAVGEVGEGRRARHGSGVEIEDLHLGQAVDGGDGGRDHRARRGPTRRWWRRGDRRRGPGRASRQPAPGGDGWHRGPRRRRPGRRRSRPGAGRPGTGPWCGRVRVAGCVVVAGADVDDRDLGVGRGHVDGLGEGGDPDAVGRPREGAVEDRAGAEGLRLRRLGRDPRPEVEEVEPAAAVEVPVRLAPAGERQPSAVGRPRGAVVVAGRVLGVVAGDGDRRARAVGGHDPDAGGTVGDEALAVEPADEVVDAVRWSGRVVVAMVVARPALAAHERDAGAVRRPAQVGDRLGLLGQRDQLAGVRRPAGGGGSTACDPGRPSPGCS